MKLSMSRLLSSVIAATVIVSVNSVAGEKINNTNSNFDIVGFVKKHLIRNPNIKLNSVEILGSKTLKQSPDWKAYMVLMDISYGKREHVKIPEIVFANAKSNLVTLKMIDAKTGKDLTREIKPTLPSSYYNDAHLVAGNKNAPHKMVVFSDPQCPFCKNFVPNVLKEIKANPDKVALYYYNKPEIKKAVKDDIDAATRMMVGGTPTVYFDGKFDAGRSKYKQYIK